MKFLSPIALILFSFNIYAADRICLLNETDQEISWTIFQEQTHHTQVNFPTPNGHTYQCQKITGTSEVDIVISSKGKREFSCSAENVNVNDVIAVKRLKDGLKCRSLRKNPLVSIRTPANKVLLSTLAAVKTYERSDDFVAFSPRLLNRTLVEHNNVSVRVFEQGKGIGPVTRNAFKAVDLNLWGLEALKLLDEVLIKYEENIKIVDSELSTTFLNELTDIKNSLISVLTSSIDSVLVFPDVNRESDKTLFSLAAKSYQKLFQTQLARAFSTESLIISFNTDPSMIPPVLIDKDVPSSVILEIKQLDVPRNSITEWKNVGYRFVYPALRSTDTLELTLAETSGKKKRTSDNRGELFGTLASIVSSQPALKQSMEEDLGKVQANQTDKALSNSKILLSSLVSLLSPLPRFWSSLASDDQSPGEEQNVQVKESSFPIDQQMALVVFISYKRKGLEFIPEFEGFRTEKGPKDSSFVFRKASGKFLTWAEAQEIPQRSILLRSDIFSKHTLNYRTVRNRAKFLNNPVKPEFLLFGEPTLQKIRRPFIQKNEPIDLQQLISLEGEGSIAQYLSSFIEGLMGEGLDDSQNYKMRLMVNYQSKDGFINIPVLNLASLDFDPALWVPKECPSSNNYPCEVEGLIEQWMEMQKIGPGRIFFSISISEEEEGRSLPLINASKLFLNI